MKASVFSNEDSLWIDSGSSGGGQGEIALGLLVRENPHSMGLRGKHCMKWIFQGEKKCIGWAL